MAETLGLPAPEPPHRNSSDFEAGAGRRERYRACYDGETRRLVEEVYAADIDFTGCRFDDPHAALVLPAGRRAKGRTASGRRHALARRLLHPVRGLRRYR